MIIQNMKKGQRQRRVVLRRTSRKCVSVCVSCKQSVCGFIKRVKIFPEREREKIRGRVKSAYSIVSLLIVLFLVCHSFTFTQTRLHCTLFIICKTRIVSVISIVEEQSV